MNRLFALQQEHFYDKLLVVSARDENQPKFWAELPWDESKYRPPLNKMKIGPSAVLENLQGDAWDEFMKKESARLIAEQPTPLFGK